MGSFIPIWWVENLEEKKINWHWSEWDVNLSVKQNK